MSGGRGADAESGRVECRHAWASGGEESTMDPYEEFRPRLREELALLDEPPIGALAARAAAGGRRRVRR
ncbi:hypothetical protein, partial [Embleya sp. NPDC005575]|uniref:hypothetical protein n=1 Tax=Embleya sp. NPDC005575 TaxID=3156892 RepID=UPI0033A245F6